MRTDLLVATVMRRLSVLAVALLLVGVAVAVPASGVATTAAEGTPAATSTSAVPLQQTEPTDGNETDANETESAAPGARLAGVLGVQGSEVSGEIESRALGERLNAAQSDRAKARVVATQYNESRERLRQLREREQRLTRAYENGSMSAGAYHARLAQVTAEIRSLERLTNRTEQTAARLPAATLERQGVNAAAVRALRRDVRNATGPEAAAAARSIAGDRAGRGMAPTAANNSSAPGRSGDAPGRSDVNEAASDTNGADRGNANASESGTVPPASIETADRNESESLPPSTAAADRNESESLPSSTAAADRNESESLPSSAAADAPAGNETDDPTSDVTTGTDASDGASLTRLLSTLFG